MSLEDDYRQRFNEVLKPLAERLNSYLLDLVQTEKRIDRVSTRAKSLERFLAKAQRRKEDGSPKYDDPLRQIQDQLGSRITIFYLSDVDHISKLVEKYFRPVEFRTVVPESHWEFGYFGKHFVLLIPTDVIDDGIDVDRVPEFFELQVKTLFQHAWSEANHDLGYKPEIGPLGSEKVRKLAFASAQAWGADREFDDLWRDLNTRSK
jgi:ppGpp synthetase/RelA/SpoT-type nucleotidyltranferase